MNTWFKYATKYALKAQKIIHLHFYKFFRILSVLKQLAGDTALYGISSILGRMLNFLLVPLYTYAFARPADQSAMAFLYTLMAVLNIVYTYGMETSFFRFAKNEDSQRYFNLIQSALIASSIGFSVLLWLSIKPIMEYAKIPYHANLACWTILILASDAVMALPFARLRQQQQAKRFATARLVNIFTNIGLNLFFLLLCPFLLKHGFAGITAIYSPNRSVEYIFIANVVANFVCFGLIWKELSNFQLLFDSKTFSVVLRYGYPIFIMGLAGMLNMMFDRLFLAKILPEGFYANRTSEDALSIYVNSLKLSVFMSIVTQAFRYATEPFFFAKAQDRNAPETFANIMKWFVIASVLIWLGISLNLDILSHLFLRRAIYREGIAIVPIALFGNLLLGVYYNLSIWFKLSDKTHIGTILTAIGLGVNAVLNIILIPKIGYMGCAVAFAISGIVMTVLCYYFGEKYYPIPYSVRSMAGYISGAGLLIALAYPIKFNSFWLSVPYHFGLWALFVAVVVAVEKDSLLPKRWRWRIR